MAGVDEAGRSLPGRSFGTAAAAYAEHRPDYARAGVRWALERASGPRVLDLGAGTGKLTAVLVTLGAQVTAVEPDPAMLIELRRGLPDVRALEGSAEKIPMPDAMSDEEREDTLSRIRAFLAGRPEAAGEFDLPMLTGVLRVRRS